MRTNGEPAQYQSEHVREALLRHPDIGELDVHVSIEGSMVVVTGHVSTQNRQDAIARVLAELMPDHDVRNETTVSAYPESPGKP